MKKAKIMLTVITVLAVVGGALAFKAKTFNGNVYCTDSDLAQQCSLSFVSTLTVVDPGEQAFGQSFCTDAAHSQQQCDQRNVYTLE